MVEKENSMTDLVRFVGSYVWLLTSSGLIEGQLEGIQDEKAQLSNIRIFFEPKVSKSYALGAVLLGEIIAWGDLEAKT